MMRRGPFWSAVVTASVLLVMMIPATTFAQTDPCYLDPTSVGCVPPDTPDDLAVIEICVGGTPQLIYAATGLPVPDGGGGASPSATTSAVVAEGQSSGEPEGSDSSGSPGEPGSDATPLVSTPTDTANPPAATRDTGTGDPAPVNDSSETPGNLPQNASEGAVEGFDPHDLGPCRPDSEKVRSTAAAATSEPPDEGFGIGGVDGWLPATGGGMLLALLGLGIAGVGVALLGLTRRRRGVGT